MRLDEGGRFSQAIIRETGFNSNPSHSQDGPTPEWLWKAFITNSYVKDLVHAGRARLGALGGDFSLPGYHNVRVLIDHVVTPDTSCYLL